VLHAVVGALLPAIVATATATATAPGLGGPVGVGIDVLTASLEHGSPFAAVRTADRTVPVIAPRRRSRSRDRRGEARVVTQLARPALNVRAPLLLAGAAVVHMVGHGGGSIISISSSLAKLGIPQNSLYATSEDAIESATRSIAAEYGSRGSASTRSVRPSPARTWPRH
jgi:NAD(P)-dependent dehydrogenase (short-subunit alcohol dehydrogenase family)